jgi:hypothetical protein
MLTQETKSLQLQTIYFSVRREHLLQILTKAFPGWEFRVGIQRLGDPNFRSEYPSFEIVSEYRPRHHDRLNRFAIYARQVVQ